MCLVHWRGSPRAGDFLLAGPMATWTFLTSRGAPSVARWREIAVSLQSTPRHQVRWRGTVLAVVAARDRARLGGGGR